MNHQLHEKVAVVSGGTTGIGLACARRLLADGLRVAVFSQSQDKVAMAEDLLSADAGNERVLVRKVDLAEPDAVSTFFADVAARWESPSVLICNAGVSPKHGGGSLPFVEIPLEEWQQVMDVNLTGAMLCCQAVAPAMSSAGFGRIVLVGSVAGRTIPRIAGTSYAVSKSALAGLIRALVSDFSGSGVTVNLVAPGRILTEMTGPANGPSNASALERIPVGRLGKPEDVASLIGFLASPDAGFINGAIIDINGGEFSPT